MSNYKLDDWVQDILANPITKKKASLEDFQFINGIIDARIFLKNSPGYEIWEEGQIEYESLYEKGEFYKDDLDNYKKEIDYDSPIYKEFPISGKVLDVGGGAGTLREFMKDSNNLVSIDPSEDPVGTSPDIKFLAYSCLNDPLNFLVANAEFVPFIENSFDIVHMRSMLDHVQSPDLSLLEAHRVLKQDGFLLVGMTIEGDEEGKLSFKEILKEYARFFLTFIGFKKFKDHHIMHPTLPSLKKILEENNFSIEKIYWQPFWEGRVVYIKALPNI